MVRYEADRVGRGTAARREGVRLRREESGADAVAVGVGRAVEVARARRRAAWRHHESEVDAGVHVEVGHLEVGERVVDPPRGAAYAGGRDALGVAGGELLIPTLVLLYGVEIKLAGSVSLAISLPTMLVGFARYGRDQAFSVLRSNGSFVLAMAGGSILGAVVGGQLVQVVPSTVLIPLLAAILVVSAIKIWRHG